MSIEHQIIDLLSSGPMTYEDVLKSMKAYDNDCYYRMDILFALRDLLGKKLIEIIIDLNWSNYDPLNQIYRLTMSAHQVKKLLLL